MSTDTTDVRQRIAQEITEGIRCGSPPWRRPWASGDTGLPLNVVSRRAYSGLNVFSLWSLARERNYSSRYWATYQQWQALGGQVRRRPDDTPPGGWGCRIVYCREVAKTGTRDDEKDKRCKLLRSYTVFALDQVDGAALDHLRHQPDARPAAPDYEPAENAVRATGADIRHGGDRAYYSRSGDFIQLPSRASFAQVSEYYCTAFHELCHWSESRLDWTGSYAVGELVAEIAGCFACSELGVPQSEDLSNHAAYVGHWLREIEAEPLALTRAAAQASKACDFLLGFGRPAPVTACDAVAFA